VDGYGNLIAARLRKLAAARSTGMLPFPGDNDGALYFRDGNVIFAESKRTPGLVPPDGLQPAPPDPGSPPADPVLAGRPRLSGSLAALLAVTEQTADAALELLSSESRFARFRSTRALGFTTAASLPVEWLLAEVTRRQRLLRQLSAILTPDTAVTRHPHLDVPGVQVSARQWALLIRVRDEATPRDLAWELGRSVFGTTAEVYRLIVLRLLSAAGTRAAPPGGQPGQPGEPNPAVLSFIRAVPGGEGGPGPDDRDAGQTRNLAAP